MPSRKLLAMLSVLMLLVVACSPGDLGDGEAGGEPNPEDPELTPHPDSGRQPNGLDDDLRVSTQGWETDFSKHNVALSEIISGGPGKDGIPAIDEPKFQPVEEVDWLEDPEPVIAFGVDDEWRAYPIQILMWHEIVNDVVADQPATITFCPLCHTAIVFDRNVEGQILDFGTTGNLRHSDLVMYDRQTETWWQQASGQGIVGEMTGAQLEFLPTQLISWSEFRRQHPDGEVLSRDTGHIRNYGSNPYAGYDDADSVPFLLADTELLDGRLSPKVRVVGVAIDDEAVAYPFPFLKDEPVVNDDVGDTPVVVLWAPGTASGLGAADVAGGEDVGSANAFDRRVGDETLTFEPAGDAMMRDTATGTLWDFQGAAVDGELEGEQLELLVSDSPFWFAWAVFRPESEIWEPS